MLSDVLKISLYISRDFYAIYVESLISAYIPNKYPFNKFNYLFFDGSKF